MIADAFVSIVEKETRQFLTLDDMRMSEETHLEIVTPNTASLFAASNEAGLVLAAAPASPRSASKTCRHSLAIALQIQGDRLCYLGNRAELGKPVVTDLEEGKTSLATLAALRRSGELQRLLTSHDSAGGLSVLRATGRLEYAMARGRE